MKPFKERIKVKQKSKSILAAKKYPSNIEEEKLQQLIQTDLKGRSILGSAKYPNDLEK